MRKQLLRQLLKQRRKTVNRRDDGINTHDVSAACTIVKQTHCALFHDASGLRMNKISGNLTIQTRVQPPMNCVSHSRAISHSLLRITCLSCSVDCDCGWSRRLISITSNGRGCAMGSSFS